MADYPAMPLWTDAYLSDTTHLTDAQHGRYLRLLILMWRSPNCQVPNDDLWLANKLGRSPEDVRTELRPLIAEFCQCSKRFITQRRLRREWKYVKARAISASESAKRRWEKEKRPYVRIANAMHAQHSEGNTPTPTPTPTPIEEIETQSSSSAFARVSKKRAPERAKRWDGSQPVPQEWRDEARLKRAEHGLAGVDLDLQAEQFANYWKAKAGNGGTKLDWHATWINWALKAENPRNGRDKPTPHEAFAIGGLLAIRERETP